MNICQKITLAFLIFYCVPFIQPAYSQVRLPALIRDSMVLQRDVKINIWGWASTGEKIRIKFNGKTLKTTAGKDGKWSARLLPMKPGGPYTMDISGTNRISLKDILIGDVWICSGQSNMVHQMALHSTRYAQEIAEADYAQIRQFLVPAMTDLQAPRNNLSTGFWKTANKLDVLQFSAVAYFFAKKIYEKYHVPIGLINASVGGTPIEAWIGEEGLKDFPGIINTLQKNKDTSYVNGLLRIAADAGKQARPSQDKGLTGAKTWYDTTYIPKGWRTINIPGYWEDQGIRGLDGVVWYRKEIDLPASLNGIAAKVFLGRIVDADVLYINGKEIGHTTYQYPQRKYNVPADLLKKGKNIIVIKVTNTTGKGGFVTGKPYCLFAGKDTIDLKGNWQYKVGEVFQPRAANGENISLQNQPSALYNAMIAPLINYTIKGFLWYQGEANTGRAEEYGKLQPAQVLDWRNRWQQGNLPFLFVQLPNFMDANYLPSESQWAELREAQLRSLSVTNTAMAVAIDLGEWNDIHPDNKKDVGERLALAAEKIAYRDSDIVYSGPLYQSAIIDGNKIKISFSNTGSGLVTNDGEELREFAIAGIDKKFVWAKAIIEGDHIIVWSDEIASPLYVRYAWADNPDGANLYNKEGLPASPFRTDR
ncbi:MAG: sialate O-acetylesterase [Ferruginibacter sp.]